jgi:hypothetical protein
MREGQVQVRLVIWPATRRINLKAMCVGILHKHQNQHLADYACTAQTYLARVGHAALRYGTSLRFLPASSSAYRFRIDHRCYRP